MTNKVFYFVNCFNTFLIKRDICNCVEHLNKHTDNPLKRSGAQLAVTIIHWLRSAQQHMRSFGMSLTKKNYETQDWHAALQDQMKITRQLKESWQRTHAGSVRQEVTHGPLVGSASVLTAARFNPNLLKSHQNEICKKIKMKIESLQS